MVKYLPPRAGRRLVSTLTLAARGVISLSMSAYLSPVHGTLTLAGVGVEHLSPRAVQGVGADTATVLSVEYLQRTAVGRFTGAFAAAGVGVEVLSPGAPGLRWAFTSAPFTVELLTTWTACC